MPLMKRIIILLPTIFFLLFSAGCQSGRVTEVMADVLRETKFHAAEISLTKEQFESRGFRLGDSLDITFGSGYSVTDVPYHDGYYVKDGAPVVVAYPGEEHVIITCNNHGIWSAAGLKEKDTVTIRLHEAKKYADIQEALAQKYSNNISDYKTAEQYCNFRELTGGRLRKGAFFRGVSPIDNSRGRASQADSLLKKYGIAFILDLADSAENIEEHLNDKDFHSPYAAGLYENGKIVGLDLSAAFQSDDFKKKLASGLREMLHAEYPVYIHCTEGKDRTGFVCLLLEALAGASYEEMRADYMKTYENYYSITSENAPQKYNAIVSLYFDPFLSALQETKTQAGPAENYVKAASDYLLSAGMTREEIELLREFLTQDRQQPPVL